MLGLDRAYLGKQALPHRRQGQVEVQVGNSFLHLARVEGPKVFVVPHGLDAVVRAVGRVVGPPGGRLQKDRFADVAAAAADHHPRVLPQTAVDAVVL